MSDLRCCATCNRPCAEAVTVYGVYGVVWCSYPCAVKGMADMLREMQGELDSTRAAYQSASSALAPYMHAVGMLSTIAPHMVIDADNPVAMATEIINTVRSLQAKREVLDNLQVCTQDQLIRLRDTILDKVNGSQSRKQADMLAAVHIMHDVMMRAQSRQYMQLRTMRQICSIPAVARAIADVRLFGSPADLGALNVMQEWFDADAAWQKAQETKAPQNVRN